MPVRPRLNWATTLLLAASVPLVAMRPAAAASPDRPCVVYRDLARLDHPLPRSNSRVSSGGSLKIVAIGSSSTSGAGASSVERSYPSQLALELQDRFPRLSVLVVNRGIGGEVAADMLARFDSAVFAENPDLVLWQVGTNSVLREDPMRPTEQLIADGIQRLKARGIDVVLIDSQFAPKVITKANIDAMIAFMARTAKQNNVNLFRRYSLMQRWRDLEGVPFDEFLSPDMLHMNDWSYGCVAKVLAVALHEAATRPLGAVASRPLQP